MRPTIEVAQAIAPTVVARKVWGGNRTDDGAHTQEVPTSVLRTAMDPARRDVLTFSTSSCGGTSR